MCPCEDCLVMVLCRVKSYERTINECHKICEYLSINTGSDGRRVDNISKHYDNIPIFEKTLNPTKWRVGDWMGNMYALIIIDRSSK